MIQEYNISIAIIEQGIAQPIADLMSISLKDLIPADKLTALKKASAPLINVTQSTVDFTKDITTKKEEFFKDNGDLTTLYNLWIRYLNKYIVKKDRSKWTAEQKEAYKQFNAKYFTPLTRSPRPGRRGPPGTRWRS